MLFARLSLLTAPGYVPLPPVALSRGRSEQIAIFVS